MEAGQWTDTLRTDLSTDQPTNRIRLKTTTASNKKWLQRDDSVPCLSKSFQRGNRIKSKNRPNDTIYFYSAPYPALAAVLGPLACSSRSAQPHNLPSCSARPPCCRPNLT